MPENLRWRDALLHRADKDPAFQSDLYSACASSPLFWINFTGWTYRKMEYGDYGDRRCTSPHVPFITWPIQDQYLLELYDAIDKGYSLLTDKSRDMGASWCLVSIFHWFWTFRPDMDFLELSRKEELVDSPGPKRGQVQSDISTLFGKHDYLYNWQPDFLKPKRSRSTRHMVNLDNRSRIDGESANENAGTAMRRDAVLIDEMAKMQYGEQIKRSLMSVSPCLLPNSTPNGAGTAYSKWRHSGTIKVFILPWWEHPEKGLGRKVVSTPTGYEITSPWFEKKRAEMSPNEVAIELSMDHIGSGQVFFEPDVLAQYRAAYACPPAHRFTFTVPPTVSDVNIAHALRTHAHGIYNLTPSARGELLVWCDLRDHRPDQSRTYAIGIDVSKGMRASNSVLSIFCCQTREKIAEYAIADQAPHQFVRTAALVALWVGGNTASRLPYMVWESNGDAGLLFGRIMVEEYGYPLAYHDKSRSMSHPPSRVTHRYGWWSDATKKEALLASYRRAIAQHTILNHSEAALDEASSYVYYAGGGIGPSALEKETENARKTHGDRVIADALALMLCESLSTTIRAKPVAPPPYSTAWFQKRRAKVKTSRLARSPYPKW